MPLPKVEPVVFVALAAGLLAGYLKNRDALFEGEEGRDGSAGDGLFEKVAYALEEIGMKLDRTFNSINWMNMKKYVPLIDTRDSGRFHPNVVAVLNVIRSTESSLTEAAYRMVVMGGTFSGFADHPRIYKARGDGRKTSAAGAYQITASHWDGVREVVGAANLPDFSPVNQERCAVYSMVYRGAINDVLAGNFAVAMKKLNQQWTSLPGGSEQLQDMATATARYLKFGGRLAGAVRGS